MRLRTQGFWFAAGVVVIDVGKGWLAAGWLPELGYPGNRARCRRSRATGSRRAARRRRSRATSGRSSTISAAARAARRSSAPCSRSRRAVVPVALAGWFLIVLLTGFVGLATMVAAATVPVALGFLGPQSSSLLALALAMAAFLVWTHRSNIARMRRGTEPRMTKPVAAAAADSRLVTRRAELLRLLADGGAAFRRGARRSARDFARRRLEAAAPARGLGHRTAGDAGQRLPPR